jgi:membrane protease YdiL (CAAX protease family)
MFVTLLPSLALCVLGALDVIFFGRCYTVCPSVGPSLANGAALFVLIGFLALLEEVVRISAIKLAQKWIGFDLSVILISALFAYFHFTSSFKNYLLIFLGSAILFGIYQYSRSFFLVVAAHGLINISQVFLFRLGPYADIPLTVGLPFFPVDLEKQWLGWSENLTLGILSTQLLYFYWLTRDSNLGLTK